MKNNRLNYLWTCSGLFLWFIIFSFSVIADDQWRTKATIEVSAPGIAEAVLLPELVDMSGTDKTDLILTGPDQHQRAFELYWREPVGRIQKALTSTSITLDDENAFVWEADLPDKFAVNTLFVNIGGQNATGKIDVYGWIEGNWQLLVQNAAVYKTNDTIESKVAVPENTYAKIRIVLKGYDRQIKEALVPIRTVTAMGNQTGRDFTEQRRSLSFERFQNEDTVILGAVLPGQGIWIKSVTLATEARFQGFWEVGREIISNGQKRFEAVKNGQYSHVDHHQQVFTIDIEKKWEGRSLVVRLHTQNRYIGEVTSLDATLNLPRLVFAADQAGTYTAYSGTGTSAVIGKYPGDMYRLPDLVLTFFPAESNPQGRLDSLVEKYQLKGGAFDPTGYTWRAALSVPQPGYYWFPLNLTASLETKRTGVRIVKDDIQVPYITGRVQSSTIDLKVTPMFDPDKNQTTWDIELPVPSTHWQEIVFHSQGIFKRSIRFLRPKPGNMGWQPWQYAVWENRSLKETAFHLNFRNFPEDLNRIRLEMDHGDNQPVEISGIQAKYATPTLYFLAHAPGTYAIYGGNPEGKLPVYDLSLVQNELLSQLPAEVAMGDLEPVKSFAIKQRFISAFKDTGWGLYAVLGLVTLIMIVIVIRLFPKTGDPDKFQKKE